jgi:maleylacetate reductase
VPTTYAGAEWTPYFGMRDEARGVKTGGSGAATVAAVYEPRLTLELPAEETVGTALNALAHAAEALYAGDLEDAVAGARIIGASLAAVVADGRDVAARTALLEGALHAGRALSERGLFLAHALAQALGGRYGLPHGAMNALSLAPALRFNEPAVPEAIARLGQALETDDAPARVEQLARLGGFERLRDFGVPEGDLGSLAADVVARPGARANPRPATAHEVELLLRSIW